MDTLHWLPMLKCTLNLAPRLIRTKNLNFEGDELTIVDCICFERYSNTFECISQYEFYCTASKSRNLYISLRHIQITINQIKSETWHLCSNLITGSLDFAVIKISMTSRSKLIFHKFMHCCSVIRIFETSFECFECKKNSNQRITIPGKGYFDEMREMCEMCGFQKSFLIAFSHQFPRY